ncbi:MAG: 23S rRNA (adenine(2503)-C(2))-methyltransferase RlmN [Planctomycetes bacterium]|nr:23S rRNA (adenine(2503)-C(2))-methyltransferase RlmN [Planctomycetota bacterium]
MIKPHLLSYTSEEIASLLSDLKQPKFRAKQLVDWIFIKRAASWEEMRNIPKELRAQLSDKYTLRGLTPGEHKISADGLTEKWLFETEDQHGVEAVLIRDKKLSRRTVCISSSLGCRLGCVFCASAQGPFIRDLTAGEMVEEVAQVEALSGEGATNVVFMGTGEPFLNYDEVLLAARRINAADGFGIGARHITISTVGVIPGIELFAAEPEDFRLAVSLHAPNQAAREKIVPAAKKWELGRLLSVLRRYTRATRREVTFEYILIDGFNAHPNDAILLAENLSGIPCKINCIPYNPIPGSEWRPPEARTCREFVAILEDRGLRATLRAEKGSDISAACGQLRAYRLLKNSQEAKRHNDKGKK